MSITTVIPDNGVLTTQVLPTTGSGNIVLDNTPTLITPDVGAATGSSLNVNGQLVSTLTTDASSTSTGSLVLSGGAGIAKSLWIDGTTFNAIPAVTANIATSNSTGTINIGTGSGSNNINLGGVNSTVTVTGTLSYQNTTNLQVTDPLITLNKNGTLATGLGVELEVNSTIPGYIKTDGTSGTSWDLKAPGTGANGIFRLTPPIASKIGEIIWSSIAQNSAYTLSDVGASANFVMTEGTQTINGVKTFGSAPNLSSLSASTPLQLDASKNIISTAIDLSGAQATGILASGRFPALTGDITTSSGSLATTAAATQANIVTLSKSTGVAVHGTNTNDSAAAGYVGEYISGRPGSDVTPAASGVDKTVTSISLTAGDWDVQAMVFINIGTSGISHYRLGISTTANSIDSNSTTGYVNQSLATAANANGQIAANTGTARISLTGTATVYIVGNIGYAVLGTTTFLTNSFIQARRIR